MKFLQVSLGQLPVFTSSGGFDGILDKVTDAPGAAIEFDDQWYLLDSMELVEFEVALRTGRPRDFIVGYAEAPRAAPDEAPSEPALVFEGDDVLGAWIPDRFVVGEGFTISRTVSGGGGGGGGGGGFSPGEILYGDFPRSAPAPSADDPSESAASEADAGEEAAAAEEEAMEDVLPSMARRLRPKPSEPPPVPPNETIHRTPHMDAPEQLTKAPGTAFEVSVYTDKKKLREGETGEGLALELPPDVNEVEVGVLLRVTDHFETVGDGEYAQLTIKRNEADSEPVSFKLQVVEEPPGGKAVISALLTLKGRSCGQIARAWDWDGDGAEASPAETAVSAPVSVPMHVKAKQADLSIIVTAPLNDGIYYECSIKTPHLEGYAPQEKSEPFAIPAEGSKFMSAMLNALASGEKTPKQRLRALREVGHEAWDAAPKIVRDVFWELIDKEKPLETINIASVEPVLPWELMIPRRDEEWRDPLGVDFAIGRWTREGGQEPPPNLPVSNSFIVAPTYGKEHRELDWEEEVEFVRDNLRGEHVKPATVDDLDARFEAEHASLLHFVCHGDTDRENDDAIFLDDEEQLRAREAETVDGFRKLCQATHPFVFLNACSTGKAVHSLSGGAGFPRSFGTLGAHAIVAPLWPVGDTLAHEIAVEVYTEALKSGAPPVASILRDIRKRAYEKTDVDTYAAYCFFGDPLARLELVDP